MRKWLSLLVLLALLLTGCTGVEAPETTPPATAALTTSPETAAPTTEPVPTLRSGYYLLEHGIIDNIALEGEQAVALKCYLYLDPDGTGFISIMGTSVDLTWHETEGLEMTNLQSLTIDGDRITLNISPMVLTLRHHDGELPEEYKTPLPVGYFLVSSVGVRGNVEFYSTADPANGYLQLNEDGTGTLSYWGVTAELTLDERYIYWNETVVPYMYHTAESSPDGMAMILLIFNEQETTVILRPFEEPAE